MVKTRFQLQQGKAGEEAYTSVVDAFRKIIKNEGFGRLYRGIVPPIMMEAPKRAIKFAANSQYMTTFGKLLPQNSRGTGVHEQWKSWLPVMTGVAAGYYFIIALWLTAFRCTEAFVVVPFDLVKIRLQDKASAGRYANTMDCVRKIIAEEGLFSFYKGSESTLWRHGVWSGVYFGCIGKVKDLPVMHTLRETQGDVAVNFVAGIVGGTLGTAFNTPFDVVKTRIQNNLYSGWTVPGIGHVARTEGVRALWKGFTPKVLRLGPGGGIMLVMFDAISQFIRENLM